MSTRGWRRSSTPANAPRSEVPRVGRWSRTTPPSPSTQPSGPAAPSANACTRIVSCFVTERAAWIVSSSTTSAPRPRVSGEAATRTAPTRLSGPSADSADAGRIAPMTMTGRSSAMTRWSSQAVSSSVFVPWVITIPSAWSRVNSPRTSSTRSARSSSVNAWARSRRKGTSRASATVSSSAATPSTRAPGGRRTPVSRYAARSSRSAPTESMVPPVVTIATRARAASRTGSGSD